MNRKQLSERLRDDWTGELRTVAALGLGPQAMNWLTDYGKADRVDTMASLKGASDVVVAAWLGWHRKYIRDELKRLIYMQPAPWPQTRDQDREINRAMVRRETIAYRVVELVGAGDKPMLAVLPQLYPPKAHKAAAVARRVISALVELGVLTTLTGKDGILRLGLCRSLWPEDLVDLATWDGRGPLL